MKLKIDADNPAEAKAHYKKAAELDPRNPRIFVEMGSEFLNLLRRFDEAQAALDRALEISPNDQSAIVGKANNFSKRRPAGRSGKGTRTYSGGFSR
jgi:tetratricopeptide (TPR) repeat protein